MPVTPNQCLAMLTRSACCCMPSCPSSHTLQPHCAALGAQMPHPLAPLRFPAGLACFPRPAAFGPAHATRDSESLDAE